MEFPKSFIRASEAYNTFEHHVPAPYLRRAFQVDHEAKANVIITALGFYELYLNGERITKGRLAPYISNPDDLVYYDTYERSRSARAKMCLACGLATASRITPAGISGISTSLHSVPHRKWRCT